MTTFSALTYAENRLKTIKFDAIVRLIVAFIGRIKTPLDCMIYKHLPESFRLRKCVNI